MRAFQPIGKYTGAKGSTIRARRDSGRLTNDWCVETAATLGVRRFPLTKRWCALFLILFLAAAAFAQDAGDSSSPAFGAGLNLGSDLLPTGALGAMESWTKLGFEPDFSIGKFGIGLDLTFRFRFYPPTGDAIEIYEPDWIPSGGQTVFDVYLPKLLYVRYGLRGIDPFFIKLGSISDFTLGNGFIVNDYSNMRFMPDQRLFGLQTGLDGALFKFPYAGFEALTGNLARFDVVGGRIYVRPLAFTQVPILKSMQVGLTGVVDRDPLLYVPSADLVNYPATELIYVLGADVTVPIFASRAASLTAFVEGAREPSEAMGAAVGVNGKLFSFVDYGAQIRYFQDGFIPTYFDANYDLYRADRFETMMTTVPGAWTPGWLASLGFDLFKEKLRFGATLDGPFTAIPAAPGNENQAAYPHLKGTLVLDEGMIGGISLAAGYEKYFIGKKAPFFSDLVDPEDAVIGLAVNYKTGATMLTLAYTYMWDPNLGDFDVSSSLTASVEF